VIGQALASYCTTAAIVAIGVQVATAADDPLVPLPGNPACPYPVRARDEQVAGTVRFAATLRADGSVASVEVRQVPLPGLGFEDAVRGCISEWRFGPAANESPRVYEGVVRFRRAPSEEDLVRTRLEQLVTSWNERDQAAVNELAVKPEEAVADVRSEATPLFDQVQALTRTAPSQLRLAEDVDLFWFPRSDLVRVRQRYSPVQTGEGGAGPAELLLLDAALMKGPRGWRFAVLAATPARNGPVRIGGRIQEPRKIKSVPPDYPEVAQQARVQGVVILEALISPEGQVTEVKVLRGIPLLDTAAIKAVQQWRYTPTYLDGEAVPVIMTVTVNFKLSSPPPPFPR